MTAHSVSADRVLVCEWCGGEIEPGASIYRSRRGEVFCSKAHRAASSAAVRRLLYKPVSAERPNIAAPADVRCERCGEVLHPDRIVWIELSSTDARFYPNGIPVGHVSQGEFPFGSDCARRPNSRIRS